MNSFFSFTNMYFFIGLAGLWFALCGVILYSLRSPKIDPNFTSMKTNLGNFMLFVVLIGGLAYIVVGSQTRSM